MALILPSWNTRLPIMLIPNRIIHQAYYEGFKTHSVHNANVLFMHYDVGAPKVRCPQTVQVLIQCSELPQQEIECHLSQAQWVYTHYFLPHSPPHSASCPHSGPVRQRQCKGDSKWQWGVKDLKILLLLI